MKKNVIFFPIETISRELDYKIILASKLASKDTLCIVGQHDFIDQVAKVSENGIYLGKNVFKTTFPCNLDLYNTYKSNNHSIFWLHEEGGIYPGDENIWKKNLHDLLNPGVLKSDDKIFAWGQFQKQYYEAENPSIPVILSGSPRFDLAENDDLSSLISTFNRVNEDGYILFNTNFSISNYKSETVEFLKEWISHEKTYEGKLSVSEQYFIELRTLSHFLEAILYLASKFKDTKFIVRPHPTEDSAIYKTIFSELSNVEVSKKFSSVEWIQKSKLIIQNGCTTSVEAYLLNKPILNYYPFEDPSNINITEGVGIICKNLSDLENLIVKKLNNPELDTNNKLNKMINNFADGASSTDIILNSINEELINKDSFEFNRTIFFLKLRIFILISYIKDKIKFFPRKYFFRRKWKDYLMAKSAFPGLDCDSIGKKFNYLNKSRYPLKLTFFGKDGFTIEVKND